MDQSSWNLLFGWITGKQCMLPEGCSVPIEGLAVYMIVFAAIILILDQKLRLRDRSIDFYREKISNSD
ncbi:MAG: hypothetical protein ABEJ83_02090 [Candidatus Nanohaloarchaea archaeon]